MQMAEWRRGNATAREVRLTQLRDGDGFADALDGN
jgi:hypothetical protein